MSKQLSPHRHISFTAHYTGYIWYQLGWSHPALASQKGRRLATWLHPLEVLMEQYVGGSMRSTLRQRHALIDRQLDQLIAQYPNLQILEIAAGLSPRGWRYLQKHPDIRYVEADLPAMAKTKQDALQGIEHRVPDVYAVDLFSDQLSQLFADLDPSRPLVIISEGLVNYFTKPMLMELWSKLAQGLKGFTVGAYLTDLYPEPTQHKLATLIWNSSKLLKFMSRSAFSFHFTSPANVAEFMQQAGFVTAQVYQPKDSNTPNHAEHLGDLVWMIEAKV